MWHQGKEEEGDGSARGNVSARDIDRGGNRVAGFSPPGFAASSVVARLARAGAVVGGDDRRQLALKALHPTAPVGLAIIILGEAPLRR